MVRELRIVPECYADTNLINVLVDKSCNHQKGCSTVCNTLDKKLKDEFAIAVIDKDKRKPHSLDKFKLVAETEHFDVMKHTRCHQFIILIKPAIESFILFAANELNIQLCSVDSKLSNDIESLKMITKNEDAKESVLLRNLYKKLLAASNFKLLKQVLDYLLDKTYSASEKDIVEILI